MSAKITTTNDSTRRRLQAQLDVVQQQLRLEGQIAPVAVAGDFLDVAQGIEQQELAQLDHPAKTPGSQELTPRLLPGPGIERPPRWEAIARREAELRRKEVAGT